MENITDKALYIFKEGSLDAVFKMNDETEKEVIACLKATEIWEDDVVKDGIVDGDDIFTEYGNGTGEECHTYEEIAKLIVKNKRFYDEGGDILITIGYPRFAV